MTTTRIDRPTAALGQAWDELADEVGAAPFLRPGWMTAWWRAFGSGTPAVVTLQQGSALDAVVPLARRGSTLGAPVNAHSPLAGSLARSPEAGKALLERMLRERPSHLRLEPLDAQDALLAAAATVGGRGVVFTQPTLRSPYVEITGEWEPYLAGLSRNWRQNVRRQLRRTAKEGQVDLDVRDGTTGLDAALDEGFRIEAAGWKGSEGTAIIAQPSTLAFYRDMARWAAERGWLRLAFLRLDGRGIAFDLSLDTGTRRYLVKTGFDEDHAALSPGTVLRAEELKAAFAAGVESYELLGHTDGWKLRWTDRQRERVRLDVFTPSGLGWSRRLAHVLATRGRSLAAERLPEPVVSFLKRRLG